jgi:undecaprenyl-diphosphatase
VSSLGHSVLVPALIGGRWARDLNVSAPESPYLAFIVGLHGSAQILALLPGISRSGVTMAAGLAKGLSHRDAARFSFLLATPVILAAGVLKIPSDLFGPLGNGVRGQVLAGSLAAAVAAYLSVRFLTRYFETRTLVPFAIYCLLAGTGSLLWLTLH